MRFLQWMLIITLAGCATSSRYSSPVLISIAPTGHQKCADIVVDGGRARRITVFVHMRGGGFFRGRIFDNGLELMDTEGPVDRMQLVFPGGVGNHSIDIYAGGRKYHRFFRVLDCSGPAPAVL